jgi:hypothetical protein
MLRQMSRDESVLLKRRGKNLRPTRLGNREQRAQTGPNLIYKLSKVKDNDAETPCF